MDSSIAISGGGIVRLDSLYSLKKIGGRLEISGTSLTNLQGLTNLDSVKLCLIIADNPALKGMNGLENLNFVGKCSQTDLDVVRTWGLYISSNKQLTSLVGLENLKTLEGCISIEYNDGLISLAGLESLSSIGECYFRSGASMRFDGMAIYGNFQLTTLDGLGKTQFGGPGTLSITKCPSLSMCEIESICKNLSSVVASNNASGCNSVAEIEAACLVPTGELGPTGPPLQITPNPATDLLQIQINDSEKWDICLYDLQGRLLYRQLVSGSQTIDVGDWPAGLYVLRAVSGERAYAGQFVKQ